MFKWKYHALFDLIVDAITDAPTSAISKSNPAISKGNIYSLNNAMPMVFTWLNALDAEVCCTGGNGSCEIKYIINAQHPHANNKPDNMNVCSIANGFPEIFVVSMIPKIITTRIPPA